MLSHEAGEVEFSFRAIMDGVKSKRLLLLSSFVLSIATAWAQSPAGLPAITGISHATFYADDLAKSDPFYATLLGWDKVPATSPQSGVRFYANHLQYVELVAPPRKGQPDRLDSVSFLTVNADHLRTALKARGVSVPDAVTVDQDGSRSFFVHDPEGNKVGFTQPGLHSRPAPKNAANRLSTHIMHAGYQVHDRARLDSFYKDILGFHLYWQGGSKENGAIEWVMMQVPNGSDWIEYMLYLPEHASREQLGSANHIAPGVVSVGALQTRLEARGWKAPDGRYPLILGVDGKLQLDLHDPDGTRIEFMEFAPITKACCSPYTGAQPKPSPGW